jgi:hypothetical protein
MAIEFHCEHCGRMVRAPDDAAGKRGRCPSCHQTVYIPTPSDQIEPLELEPMDEKAEREREKLLRETYELETRILSDREAPPENVRAGQHKTPEGAMPPPAPGAADVDVKSLVIDYAVAMAEGRLSDAEEYAEQIRPHMKRAEDVMQQLTVDEIMPERLQDIPRPVLVGFFKQLRAGA